MKIIIELDGPQARRALMLLSESFATEESGHPTEASSAMDGPESLLAANVVTTDAGPAPPELFRAFGRTNDAEAVERALAHLSAPRRPSGEP